VIFNNNISNPISQQLGCGNYNKNLQKAGAELHQAQAQVGLTA
jgi:hypothetical protein